MPQPGELYDVIDNGDGTFDVLDVPIMGVLPAGARGNDDPLGAEWMTEAIRRCHAREAHGYLPPLHIRHHSDILPTERAGHLRLRRVGTSVSDPDRGPEPALFADLVAVPAAVMRRMQAGELPYRSIEFHADDTPEVQSLALLEDEVPFFRFPLLRLREPVKRAADMPIERYESSPALAMCRDDATRAVLYRMEHLMNKPEDEKPDELMDEKPEEEMAADDTAPASEPESEEAEAEAEEQPAATDGIEAKLDRVLSMLERMIAKQITDETTIDALSDDKADTAPADPAELAEDEKPDHLAAASAPETAAADKPDKLSEAAAARVELAAANAAERRRNRKDATDKLIAEAERELSAWYLDDEDRADIATFAKDGAKTLKAYIASFKRRTPRDPPASLAALDGSLGAMGTECEEVMAYAGDRAALKRAKQLRAEHERLSASSGFRMSLRRFLELNINRETASA